VQKKLTITVDKKIYEGLHRIVGRGRISKFIEELVRPYLIEKELMVAYRQMSQDHNRESEALEWSEAMIKDADDEAR